MVGEIKNIIVIESLSAKDGVNYTGEALYNDFIKRRIELYEKKISHKFHKISSKDEFIEILNYYIVNSSYMNGGIVIHLEMHGANDQSGLIFSDGSLINWEQLADLFRYINVATCDKLFITIGACFGRFLYKGVDAYKKSPYSGYISASIEVNPEEIYIKFGKLFEEIIDNGNIVDAYLEMEKTESNFFYKDSERIFYESFKTTMKQLKQDKKLKADILQESIIQIKNETGAELNEHEADAIFDIALQDIYNKQKRAFDFTDCK